MLQLSKTKKLPAIAGLTDRPKSIKSGRPLKERVKICYRSDLYMDEQFKIVISFQEQLKQAMKDLSSAKSSEMEFHKKKVEELKMIADEMIIILQISGKLDRELAYARKDLLKAVESGADSKIINKFRKRVQWLESKLEQLIVKYSPARKQEEQDMSAMSSPDAFSALGDNSVMRQSASLPMDSAPQSRLHTMESYLGNSRLNTGGTDASTNAPLNMSHHWNEHIVSGSGNVNRLLLHRESADILEVSMEHEYPPKKSPNFGLNLPVSSSPLADDGLGADLSNIDDAPDTLGDESNKIESRLAEQSARSAVSAVSSLFTDVTDEGARYTQTSGAKEIKPAILKPVTRENQSTRQLSRVQLKTPPPTQQKTIESPLSTTPQDRYSVMSYSSTSVPMSETLDDDYDDWIGEHHRMEFSALKQYLSELDPNSLHQVGIAIPANYVEKAPEERKSNLPWRLKDDDTKDINRDGLDLLNKQILHMQDRIYEAAMQSVDIMHRKSQSLRDLSSMARTITKIPSISRGGTQVSVGTSRPVTGLGELPRDDEHVRQTPQVSMVYYSKEIPPPKPLPITRVNRSQCYPQLLTSFVKPDPDNRLAPERIVDQGNLLNETKLVIYKPPKRTNLNKTNGLNRLIQSSPDALQNINRRSQMSIKSAATLVKSASMLKPDGNLASSRSLGEKAKIAAPAAYHGGNLRWKRIQELCDTELKSPYVDTRRDAAKQLGKLQCGDPTVFHSLKTAIVEDNDERVQYEAMRALISLGCLENEVIQMMVDYLIIGNEEIRLDLLQTLCKAKNIAFINKTMPVYEELTKVLAYFCKETSPKDNVSFQAAITFGKICTKNEQAVSKMYSYLKYGMDTHKKSMALGFLVKEFNETTQELAQRVLEQLVHSPVWEYRRASAQLLQHLGRKHLCRSADQEAKIYAVLEQRLWDDATEIVRLECAKTLVTLDMYAKSVDLVIKRLQDPEASVRAHAITSLGTLGIKQPKIIRYLAEMLELDPSNSVRREIIKAFATLQIQDKNVLRILRDKERGEGVLAQEARRSLKVLESTVN